MSTPVPPNTKRLLESVAATRAYNATAAARAEAKRILDAEARRLLNEREAARKLDHAAENGQNGNGTRR